MLKDSEPGLDIALICHGWYPDVGGVESHTRDLARELTSRGHRVRAICMDYGEREAFSLSTTQVDDVQVTRMAYRYHDHHALADLVHNEATLRVLLDWIASKPTDVVHVHHLTGFGTSILEAIRELGKPLVMTLHDYWSLCPRGQMFDTDGKVTEELDSEHCGECLAKTWPHLMPSGGGEGRGPDGSELSTDGEAAAARTKFAIRCLESADRLFTPSAAAKSVYVKAGLGEERIEVVPNGIEVKQLSASVRRQRAVLVGQTTHAEIRLGVLGTLLPSKGCLELIRAFQEADVTDLTLEIHGNMPSYHGDASYVEKIREIAESDPRIRVHGPYDHARLATIMASLDGVAAPSRWCEVFGLTVREARAAGLPVLVSNAGDLGSVAAEGKAGVVVDVDDHDGWVQALKTFADYKHRASWRRHDTSPRSAYDMMLQLEEAYVSVIQSVTGAEPSLRYPAGQAQETGVR